ncbi:MAG: hypothetical protein AB7P14_01600 [Blastocatellales bacterium]
MLIFNAGIDEYNQHLSEGAVMAGEMALQCSTGQENLLGSRSLTGDASVGERGEIMTLCEFCMLQQPDGSCSNGHKKPLKMRCMDFAPGISRFCKTPSDFEGQDQLKQMALFFGIAGKELKRVLAMGESAKKVERVEQ